MDLWPEGKYPKRFGCFKDPFLILGFYLIEPDLDLTFIPKFLFSLLFDFDLVLDLDLSTRCWPTDSLPVSNS